MKFTSEGRLEAEVNVLLGVQADDEAGHIHHLNGDQVNSKFNQSESNVSPLLGGALEDTSSMSLFRTVAVLKD